MYPNLNVSRECGVGGQWKGFDRQVCELLTEELKNLSAESKKVIKQISL